MATDRTLARRHVAVLGLNHRTSDVAFRDRVLFPGSRLEKGLTELGRREIIEELVIVSTCNRLELYAVGTTPPDMRDALLDFLVDFHGVERTELVHRSYFYHCEKAVMHLLRVMAGLDSMVVGESQIQGQVKQAFYTARDMGTTGTMLNRLFPIGIEAGKRVRTETRINEGLVSIPSVAVELAQKIVGRLDRRTVLILGAGEMSKLTAGHLVSAGTGRIFFANRSLERAQELAERFNGSPLLLQDRVDVLRQCDMLVSSTGCPHYIITPEEIGRVMAQRRHRPLFLIDIAAPRDIDPRVGEISNAFLYTIDDLSRVVSANTRDRMGEIGAAEKVVREEAEKFFEWYHSLKILPALIALRRQFRKQCDQELRRYGSEIDALPEQSRDVIKRFAVSLTKRFLRGPTRIMRDTAQQREGVAMADSVVRLFELELSDEEDEGDGD